MNDAINSNTAGLSAAPHQAIGPATLLRLERAKQEGDIQDIAYLYAWAAAWIKGGKPVPEPVGAFIAERMKAISSALQAKDMRAEIVKAVAPHPKNNRPQGARPARIDRLASAAQAVIDLLQVDDSRGRRTSLVTMMSKATGYKPASIDRAISKLRGGHRK